MKTVKLFNFHAFNVAARAAGALFLATVVAPMAQAATTNTWDTVTGDTTITDGSGTWQVGVGNWYTNNGTTSAYDQPWADNATAAFGGTAGTAGTVTLGGNIKATSIIFNAPAAGHYTIDTSSYILTNGNITVASGAGPVVIQSGAGGSVALSGNATWNVTGANALTVASRIIGAFNLTKSGAGDMTLSCDTNSFSGTLATQNGNSLYVGSIRSNGVSSAAGAGNLIAINSSGTLVYTGAGDTTDRTLSEGGANGTSSTLSSSGTGPLVFAGAFTHTSSGTGTKTFTIRGTNTGLNEIKGNLVDSSSGVLLALTKDDIGTWVLSGNNSYGGLTTITLGTLTLSGNNSCTNSTTLTAGTLNLNSTTALGATASTFNINGGTIDNTSGSAKTLANNNPITLGGSFAYGTSAGTAANNLNLGTGAVSIGASRTITLNGAGALTFGGVLSNTAAAGMSVTVTNGTGTTSTSAVSFGGISITAAGDATSRNLFFYGDGNINVTGAIVNGAGTGVGTLQCNNTGTLTFTGNNAYTGGTSLNSGVLDAIDGTGLPTSSSIQLKGGVFQSSGTFIRAVANGNGKVNWGGGNSGGFAARGGVLNLQLNNGTGSLTWGSSYTQVAGDGFSLIFGSSTADNLVDFKNGLNLGSGAVATRTITVNDNPNSSADIARISGAITETTVGMSLLKDGAGTLELTGNNTYTGGTIINNGTLTLGAQVAALNAGAVQVAGGGYNLGGFNATNGAITMSSGAISNGTLKGMSFAFSGGTASANLVGTGALTNNTGTTIVSGANTYNGGTVVNSGTLQLGASAALPSAQAVTVAGGTLDIHGYNPNAGAVTLTSGTISGTGALTGTSFAVQSGTISSVLAGSGALTKSTAGTLTLSGANTYTGGTTIDNGTLALSGSGMLGSGGININSLATLDASAQAGGFALTGGQSLTNRGTFIGGLIIQSGANVSGGGSFNGAVTNLFGGTLTPGIGGDTNFFQSLTLADGSTNSFWIGNSAHDMSVVSNSLTVTGTGIPELKLDLSGYTWNRDDQFVIYDNLFSGYSSLNGTNSFFQFRDAFGVVSNLYNNALFSAITGTGGSSATNLFRINYDVLANGDGQYNDIAITAIPEPASLNLLVMLGAAYWMRRRLHSQRRRWGL